MTMRKVTEQICEAFLNGESKTVGNTETDGQNIWLHGNLIATKDAIGTIFVSFAGHPTATTKERLNGLAEMKYMMRPFHTVKRVLMANGKPINTDKFNALAWFC